MEEEEEGEKEEEEEEKEKEEEERERDIIVQELPSRVTRLVYIPPSPQCRATVLGNIRWPGALTFGL